LLVRVTGFIFSALIAVLLSWVAVAWSNPYIEEYRETLGSFRYFTATYHLLFGAFGLIVGFTVASLMYRQAVDLWVHLVSDIQHIPARDKFAVIVGVFIGLGITYLVGPLLIKVEPIGWQLVVVVGVIAIYFGVLLMMSMKDEFTFFFPGATPRGESALAQSPLQAKLLDTNVIIDGRIADIARAGFIEGMIYVPRFVLEELHLIADSSDTLKRNRGRRGLDILNDMQDEPDLQVLIYDDHSGVRDTDPVDARLVSLAKEMDAAVVTNDFNLNKVAQLQGVRVLNVNELANAVKPVVLPGEELTVMIVREGKEPDQGVAYLDDGTMVVVERGREHIGETIRIVVTSVLQTVAGKMIFGNPQNGARGYQEDGHRNQRVDTSGGARRKARSS
jgi:uncharacterized protein YacL